MNTLLSENAVRALKRIHTLKDLTKLTGLITTREQGEILLTLSNEDALAVANVLKNERVAR
jgi:hypothetical protein